MHFSCVSLINVLAWNMEKYRFQNVISFALIQNIEEWEWDTLATNYELKNFFTHLWDVIIVTMKQKHPSRAKTWTTSQYHCKNTMAISFCLHFCSYLEVGTMWGDKWWKNIGKGWHDLLLYIHKDSSSWVINVIKEKKLFNCFPCKYMFCSFQAHLSNLIDWKIGTQTTTQGACTLDGFAFCQVPAHTLEGKRWLLWWQWNALSIPWIEWDILLKGSRGPEKSTYFHLISTGVLFWDALGVSWSSS